DYVAKPFTPAQIRAVVERLRERRGLRARVESLEDRLAGVDPDALLETRSASMQAALSLLRRAAASDAAVLLRGENGTAKSVLAHSPHRPSYRSEKPFVTVSAPTLSDELLISELFGHARGTFTGALRDTRGKVQAADGGTLFLSLAQSCGSSNIIVRIMNLRNCRFPALWKPDASCDSNSADWRSRGSDLDTDQGRRARVGSGAPAPGGGGPELHRCLSPDGILLAAASLYFGCRRRPERPGDRARCA